MTRRDPFPVLDFRECADWPTCQCAGECDVEVSRRVAGRLPVAARLCIAFSIGGLIAVCIYLSL